MGIIIFLIIVIVVVVIPVQLSAKYLGAGKTNFLSCVFSVVVASIAQTAISSAIPLELVALIVNIALIGLIYSVMLSAEYKKGVLIGVLSVVLQVVIVSLLAGLGIFSGVVELET